MTTQTLEVYEGAALAAPPALFGTDDPEGVIARASAVARPLAQVIRDRKLFKQISGRDHVLVEGWTLLGSMLGVFPVTAWCRPVEGGWEARVEARTLGGALVGGAEAQCTRSENTWRNREDFALRSMAQTRATSKALRMPLGFVMALAGYETTPVEEMPVEDTPRVQAQRPQPQPPAATKVVPNALVDVATLKRLVAAGKEKGIEPDAITQRSTGRFGRGPKELTMAEAQTLIAELERMAPPTRDGDPDGWDEQSRLEVEVVEQPPEERPAH